MTVQTSCEQSLLTPVEAASVLNISPRHLHNLRKAGRIAAVQLGRSVRYHRDAVDSLARAGFNAAS